MRDLLPCPFCGGAPVLKSGAPGCHWIECAKCKVQTDDRNTPEIPWNTRADLPKVVDVGMLRRCWPHYNPRGKYTTGWNDCLNHLITLGVIQDKKHEKI